MAHSIAGTACWHTHTDGDVYVCMYVGVCVCVCGCVCVCVCVCVGVYVYVLCSDALTSVPLDACASRCGCLSMPGMHVFRAVVHSQFRV